MPSRGSIRGLRGETFLISVLYVDDEPDLLELARLFLEQSGEFQIATSISAQDALASPAIRSYDAIISDYQMPGMDGIAFLKVVREQFGDLPFILFTGKGREEVVIEAINNGADFYVQKGGDPKAQFAELAHKVRQAVRRKRAEITLAKQEQHYLDLQNASDLIMSVAPDGHFLFVNKKWLDTLGYKDDLDTLRIFDIIHDESLERFKEHISCVLSGENVGIIDVVFRARDGSKVYAEGLATGNTLNGKPQYIRGIFKDVTERRELEAALAENHDFLQQIYTSAREGAVIIDAETHKIIDLNPAAARMIGAARDQIVNNLCHQYICTAEPSRCPITVLHRNVDNAEHTLLTADGRTVDIIKHVAPFNFRGKECLLETFIDNTERKKAADELRSAYEKAAAAEEELRKSFDLLTRKKQALRESTETLRAVVEQSNEGIVIANCTGRVLYANRRAADIVESATDLDAAGGINVLDVVSPDTRESAIQDLGRVVQGNDPVSMNCKIVTLANREKRLECICGKLSYKGSPAMLLSFRDVTERMQAEKKLRDSEYKFSTIFKSNPVSLTLTSISSGVFTDVNDAFLRNTGYARAEVIGKTSEELGLFADSDEFARFVSTLRKKHFVQGMELRCRSKAGEIRTCRFSSSTVSIDGMPHILSTIEDVTEQKRAQEAIRENGERYRLILENASEGILVNEITPRGPGRFIDANESACRILGMTREELQGVSLIDLDTPEMQKRAPELIQELLQTRRVVFQTSYVAKDNREKILDVTTSLFDLNGRPTMLTVVRDVTEIKAAERALRALVTGMVGTTGTESLDRITESISTWLGADGTMIGEITSDHERVQVLSMILDGKKIPEYSYTLHGTLSEHTIETGFCTYPDNVTELFPESQNLHKFNIRGYYGTALRNSEGQVVGVLCILSRTPLNLPPSAREFIDIIAAKAAAEIDRLNALRALSESEEKFRTLVEHSLDGILILDLGGKVLFANNAAGRIIEAEDPDDIIGKRNVMEFIAADSQGDALRDLTKAPEGTDGYIACYRVLTVNQKERWVESIGKSITVKGTPSILISVRDITERQRAQEALKKSEELLELVMNGVPTLLSYLDTELRFVYINKAHAAWYGRPWGDLIGKSIKNLLPESGYLRISSYFQRALDGQEIGFESLNRDREGREHIFAVHLVPHVLEGRVVGIFSALTDITERKRMEEALKESETRFHSMFERHGSIMLLLEPGTGKIIDANFAAERFYRKAKSELCSLSIRDFSAHSPETIPADPLRAERDTFFTSSHRVAGGEIRVVEAHSSPISMEGRTVHFSVINDITERRRAEDALRQANKKLNLLSGITRHDINNQLQILDGYLELLRERNSDPIGDDYLSRISTASSRISSMILFSKEYEMVGVHLPVWQEIRALVSDAGRSASLGRVALKNGIPTGVDVLADPLISKVFSNLIDNALRHGETITTIRFTSVVRDGSCVIVCEDDGDGIAPELKERIFARGFGKNTGLGLSLSREILDITGITIEETGEPGRGARFEITVPQGRYRVCQE